MAMLGEAALFLGAAVLAVPLTKRLGLGAVLGYLCAGAAIGPSGLGLVQAVDDVLHFAEFGVVLLLFVIGLELQPNRLWTMRKAVFGLGLAQVIATGSILAVVAWIVGVPPATAAVIGTILALSSTAFALQVLAERQELTSRHGRSAFAILLFQDLAAIPLIALIPLIGEDTAQMMTGSAAIEPFAVLGALAAIAVAGRYLCRYAFRVVAATRVGEVFTAFCLFVVIGTALLMQAVGLSAALGAFLAGVLLAESEYRHAIHADLEPFKGLLLGLFFIAVGMSLNGAMIVAQPGTVALIVCGLVAIKIAAIYALARAYGMPVASARSLALVLSQGGEFAFVLFGLTASSGLLSRDLVDLLNAAVTLSMVTTPLLLLAHDALTRRRTEGGGASDALPVDAEPQVIIAGFGRFGQIIGRILRARRIPFTALEKSAEQVQFARLHGAKVYYGDASRLDLLHAANAAQAIAFVIAVDDPDDSVRIARTVREHFAHLRIYARARNRHHSYRLMEFGIDVVWRETFLSALDMAREVLGGLGLSDYAAQETVETFRAHDEARLYSHFGQHRNERRMQALAKQAAQELEELLAQDTEPGSERRR